MQKFRRIIKMLLLITLVTVGFYYSGETLIKILDMRPMSNYYLNVLNNWTMGIWMVASLYSVYMLIKYGTIHIIKYIKTGEL